MHAFQREGRRIGTLLHTLKVSEVTVTQIAIFEQAVKGTLDFEIVADGRVLFFFRDMTEQQVDKLFDGMLQVYKGDMNIRHNLPILTEANEGDIRYRNTSWHSSHQHKEQVKVTEYENIIKYENLFQISPTVKELIQKQSV